MRRFAWMICLGVLAGAGALPRAQGQEPQAPPPDTPTFRVGTRLATIDAVVLDSKGRHVTDLRPEDFEVVERGKRQTVRQAVYVQVIGPDGRPVPQPVAPGAPAASAPEAAIATAARPLDGGNGLASAARASRVIAIVVDDLGLSFESTAAVRTMLNRYVEQRIAAGDLVAIIRTAGGVGALQQFTTDRRLLAAAIERVRWSPFGRSGVGAFKAVEPVSSGTLAAAAGAGGGPPGSSAGAPPSVPGPVVPDVDTFRDELATTGTLGALEYVLRGIEPLSGRKSVVFVSEGFDLGIRDAQASRAWSAFTRVMDRANRAGVVVYTIDPRGLQTTGMTAEDDPQTAKIAMPGQSAPTGAQLSKVVSGAARDRLRALFDSQDSLLYLAEQTGGFAVLNTNDIGAGMGRIIDDTRGYYLLGFDTAIAPSDRWDPNDVHIRLKRPGLTVRARRGLFGPAEKERPHDTVPDDPLLAATLSPFAAGAIDVRLTTLFAHDAKDGSYVRSLFFVDPAGLTFVDGADGKKEADLSLLLLAIGDNGQAVAQARLKVPLRLDAEGYTRLRQRGLLYSARLPIKDPGGYQIRAAIQDDRSKTIGTSAQFVEIPKVGKDTVAISGVVMADLAATAGSGEGAGAAPTLVSDTLADGVLGQPAVKIFKPGSEVAYACEIYDGRGKRKEELTTRATLLRDGKAFYTTPPAAIGGAPPDATPVGTVPVGGKLTLGRGLPRGTYTLQVSVGPPNGRGGRDRQASQWVDFEVR